MKIAIAGPGRSGTSLLVRLLDKFGFTTPSKDGNWSEEAQAGLESRIGSDMGYEVDKDPWAYEYIERIDREVLKSYDALVVPIRDLEHASISRFVMERLHRAKCYDQDYWMWDSWASVPGGAITRSTVDSIASALSIGLWQLLEKASLAGIQPIILHFPRFASDFEYFWYMLGPIISTRQSKESAQLIWSEIADVAKVHIGEHDRHGKRAEVRALQAMIDFLRNDINGLTSQLTQSRDACGRHASEIELLRSEISALHSQLNQMKSQSNQCSDEKTTALAERDHALAQLHTMKNSKIWRLTTRFKRLMTAAKPQQ
jgi:hypothetical protein